MAEPPKQVITVGNRPPRPAVNMSNRTLNGGGAPHNPPTAHNAQGYVERLPQGQSLQVLPTPIPVNMTALPPPPPQQAPNPPAPAQVVTQQIPQQLPQQPSAQLAVLQQAPTDQSQYLQAPTPEPGIDLWNIALLGAILYGLNWLVSEYETEGDDE